MSIEAHGGICPGESSMTESCTTNDCTGHKSDFDHL